MRFAGQPTLVTLTALGPFGLSATSKDTRSPSRSSSKVTLTRSLEWKKRSLSCPSRLINPNPRSVIRAIVPSCIDRIMEVNNPQIAELRKVNLDMVRRCRGHLRTPLSAASAPFRLRLRQSSSAYILHIRHRRPSLSRTKCRTFATKKSSEMASLRPPLFPPIAPDLTVKQCYHR